MEQESRYEKYGYVFAEKGMIKPEAFVGNSLIITLNQTVTKQHFDPKQIEAAIYDPTRSESVKKRFGLTAFMSEHTLLPGIIRIIDQNADNHKHMSFYTFGALIQSEKPTDLSQVVYMIQSDAPIIQLTNIANTQESFYWKELAMRTEAELAKMRAKMLQKAVEFNLETLLNPNMTYQAAVKALLNKQDLTPSFKAWLQKHRQDTPSLIDPPIFPI